MRLLFILMLSIISSGIYADTTVSNIISMGDDRMCQRLARLSAKSLQNARLHVSLNTQLKAWDEFAASDNAKAFTNEALAQHRNLINLGWEFAAKYPTLKPNDYGDMIYAACANDKELTKVKI